MLANLLLLAAAVFADSKPIKGDYFPMQNPQILYSSDDYIFRIEMRNEDAQFTTIIELEALKWDLDRSYIAIGFGNGMLVSRFIVCHNNGDGSVGLHEHFSLKIYAPPVHDYGPDVLINPVSGLVRDNRIQQCVFTRPYASPNPQNPTLDPNTAFKMIWAFNPATQVNYRNERFTYHGENSRGLVLATISKNTFEATPNLPNFKGKAVHGFGMMVIWLLVLPTGAFIAR
jgi:hypothetical protein